MDGQTVCRNHGGNSGHARAAAQRRLHAAAVEQQLGDLLDGLELDMIDVHPLEVLADQVRRASVMATVLGVIVGNLKGNDLVCADIQGRRYEHPASAMYRQWSEQAARLAKLGIDAGLEERRVVVAETQGRQIAEVLTASFTALRLALGALVPGDALDAVWRDELPGIVRAAIETTVRSDVAS